MSLSTVVSGMVAGTLAQGGASWAVLQYVVGLARLGHRVHLIEPVDGRDVGRSPSSRYARDVMRSVGLDDHWCLLGCDGSTAGMSYGQVLDVAGEADLLINISGMLTDPAVLDRIPVRAYLDLDPGFIQLWHAVEGIDMRFTAHNRFVTIGHALGSAGCPVPDCGLEWLTTHQPVVLEEWPCATEPPARGFTTIANWRGYGSVVHEGVVYGQKVHSVRPLFSLAQRTSVPLEVALAIDPGETRDLDALHQHGWHLVDAAEVTRTPDTYRDFVRTSTAELGVAKSGYVAARVGWFSDRSVCYLASGRPVLAQDTGIAPYLPLGEGLLTFYDVDTAADGIEAIMSDYPRHAATARAIAEDVFDSDRVLATLLERLA
jgi:hypothetical protein